MRMFNFTQCLDKVIQDGRLWNGVQSMFKEAKLICGFMQLYDIAKKTIHASLACSATLKEHTTDDRPFAFGVEKIFFLLKVS